MKLREEAVRLLERANLASSSPKLPNLERVDTFRVFTEAGVQEGSFNRVVIQGTGWRDEYGLADYHLVKVWTMKQVAVTGNSGMLPAALRNVLHITPIWHVRFDGEDIIHSIADRELGGQAARCIAFDTVRGQHADHNEICVDTKSGVLLLENLGGERVEYSDFFPFAGASMPGKITYSRDGVGKIEISQTMTELGPADANVLAPPMNAEVHKRCTTYRRAFGLSMPQPRAGSGGGTADIVVRVMVGADGRVYDASIESSERDDLNAEALALSKQWTFTPSVCDGHPQKSEADVALEFQGR